MNKYNYLLEKAKEEKIEKNVVGAVIINRQGKILPRGSIPPFHGGLQMLGLNDRAR